MDKFLVGAVVGFFVCNWLTNRSTAPDKDGIQFLKEQVRLRLRPGTADAALVSGFVSKNRSL
jgi:hypothetical protein